MFGGDADVVLARYDNAAEVIVAGGYIRGGYVMNRSLAGTALNPTNADHATDTLRSTGW